MEKIQNADDIISNLPSNGLPHTHVVFNSSVPDLCKSEPCILGVDEAGRGPVLGPMVYGISFCPVHKASEFATLGYADSKALTEKNREELFAVLCASEDYVGWAVDVITPNYISNCMLKSAKKSLNEIAEESTVGLIQRVLSLGANIAEIYVDTVGPPEKYRDKLLKFFPDCKITVAKKADALYPIVSAASICAKVTRDKVIENWIFTEDIEPQASYGSGYPGDPATKKFMVTAQDPVFGYPNLVRFSWSTADKLLQKDGVLVEWEEDEDENKPSVRSYFKSSSASNQHVLKHPYFKERNLTASNLCSTNF